MSVVYGNIHYADNRLYRVYQKPRAGLDEAAYQRCVESGREAFEDDHSLEDPVCINDYFLQIYDLNDGDKLIFDGPVPSPFNVLSAEGDTFWAVAGATSAGLIVRRYKLTPTR